MYLALQLVVFQRKEIHFVLCLIKMFLSDFKICFYDRNTFHMICGKFEIILASKISIWPQYSEDVKQKFLYVA